MSYENPVENENGPKSCQSSAEMGAMSGNHLDLRLETLDLGWKC